MKGKKDKFDEINENLASEMQKKMNVVFDKVFAKVEKYIENADPKELSKEILAKKAEGENSKAFCGIMCETCTIAKSTEK